LVAKCHFTPIFTFLLFRCVAMKLKKVKSYSENLYLFKLS
jgi:hypothetical protein